MPAKKTTEERLSQHDREIVAIRKLLMFGAQNISELHRMQREMRTEMREARVEARAEMKELRAEMRALASAQNRTEATLDRFIRSLERGPSNGHAKKH